MIAIQLRKPLSLLVLMAGLAAMLSSAPARAATSLQVDLGLMNSYVDLVQRESLLAPTAATLIDGATTGLRGYLSDHAMHPDSGAITPSLAAFRHEFSEAAARYPHLDQTALFYACLKGMLKPLNEPYTRFLTPSEFRDLEARVEGTDECGLGLRLELDNQRQLVVSQVFAHTPASAAGMQAGDRILTVDGKPTQGLTLTRGQHLLCGPVGDEVMLGVRRDQKTMSFSMQRGDVKSPSVTFQKLANHIGYVRLYAFSQTVADEMDNALRQLDAQGCTAYIVDLRDNRGGYVSSALDVCSRFLPTGSLVMTLMQRNHSPIAYTTYATSHLHKLMAVLVNERTASASEIVTGALQDHEVCTVMGTRSFGKALVQKVIPLPDGSAFTITTGKYVTPNGHDLQKRGITPDVALKQSDYAPLHLDAEVQQALALVESRLSAVSTDKH